ncbi:unnamed protein product [Agarophyton chilense]
MECASAPRISSLEAAASSLCVTALYVGCLYLPFNRGARDAPQTIRSRLFTLALLLAALELYVRTRLALPVVSRLSLPLPQLFVGALLTALLYAGHLAVVPLRHTLRYSVFDRHQRFVALRNYVVGPLLEEICFRRHTILLWSCHPAPLRIFVPAVMFALAHVHHVMSVGFSAMCTQFVITFLFGTYAGALYINTRSVCSSIAAHVLCNMLELPNFDAILSHRHRVFIITLYCCALVAFAVAFAPLTTLVRPSTSASQ